MTSRPLIRAICLSGVAEAISSAGISPDEVYRAAGLARSGITDPQQWLPLNKVADLFEAAARRLGQDTLGLRLGASIDPRDLGLLAYLVLYAPTLQTGIQSVQRYIRLLSDGVDIELHVSDDRATVTYVATVADVVERRQLSDWAVAVLASGMRRILGPQWAPQQVHFKNPRPADIAPYEQFFSTDVLFNRPRNRLVFDAASLNFPPQSADPRLHDILEAHADAILVARPQEDGIIDLLRVFVVRSLSGGYPAIDVAAQELGASVRTLQRRLREIGTDYSELVDDMRRDLARKYLDDEGLTLKEIAHLLGYSQPSAFNRAWRRWTGGTPQEYRHRQS